ncbi:MAG: flagellar assembly peptidoglycan hydrolase FlgJ [Bermanella sp.]
MNNISNTYNYNDLASLNAISTMADNEEAGALKQVAHQFESMFVGMMLKSMRDANAVFEEDNPLNSNESKFYRQMFDDQLALSMSQGEGIGLADSIYRQLKDQFDVKDSGETKPDQDIPLRQYTGPNPFSSLKPDMDLPQFKQTAKAFDLPDATSNVKSLEETAHKVVPLNTIPLGPVKIKDSANTNEAENKPEQLGPISKQSAFETPQEFVDILWPVAQKVGEVMGVDPKAIVAQAALETGWGKHIIHQGGGKNSHNLFGIKADQRWDGDVAKVSTLEYREGIAKKEIAPFRVYDSYEHSLTDYAKFVQDSERYKAAIENGKSIKGYSEGLQNGGYATDPNYAQKIQRIASGDMLAQAIDRAGRG